MLITRLPESKLEYEEFHLYFDKPLALLKSLLTGNKVPYQVFEGVLSSTLTFLSVDDMFTHSQRDSLKKAKVEKDLILLYHILCNAVIEGSIGEPTVDGILQFFFQTKWYREDLTASEVFAELSHSSELADLDVGLFGSFQSSTQTLYSDIDLVLFTEGVDTEVRIKFEDDLSISLGRVVRIATYAEMRKEVQEEVSKSVVRVTRAELCP